MAKPSEGTAKLLPEKFAGKIANCVAESCDYSFSGKGRRLALNIKC
jgi:hypothetical protein